MKACMGGWCKRREQCPHHMEASSDTPAERLCVRGRDGVRLISASAFRTVLVEVFTGKQIENYKVEDETT